MANRTSWRFQYPASQVLAAVRTKITHHNQRLLFWQNAQAQVMKDCKEQGLVVHESLAGNSYSTKSPGFGPRIEIPVVLQEKLNESTGKITEHTTKLASYVAWAEVLTDASKVLELDSEDYLFFFGKN